LFAATFPERTASLILWGAYARCLRASDYPWGFPEHLAPRVADRMEDHWDEPHAINQIAPSSADDPRVREWWATMQRQSVSPAAAVALWKMAIATDVRDVLSAVHVPTLVMHLADDRLIDPGCGHHLADNIAGATFVELPGADTQFVDFTPGADAIEEFLTGRIVAPEPDRALATVMFTDIVESTTQLTQLGDHEWRQLLNRHDALIDRALERFRGRKITTTGDGVLATFDGPARAVQCACAIRDGVESLGIEIRAGVHTGEVELRGDDVTGMAVHIGARVVALAAGREVLVTRTVTDLVAGSGLQFRDRGEHELKGLPGNWQIYAVAET
jgi:class 3 adenylate cyclase